MEKVVIYGIGRHAELVAHEMKRNNLFEVVAFTVSQEYFNKSRLQELPIVPFEKITQTHPPEDIKMFIAIGPQEVNRIREKLFKDAKSKGYTLVNCLWPIPNFPEDLKIGENVYIGQECAISNFVEIGDNATIITSRIGHHCKIGDNSFISASILAGNVQVEKNVFIGLGSTIGPNITLGPHTVVGMGCVISKNTAPASVYLNKATEKQSFDSSKVRLS